MTRTILRWVSFGLSLFLMLGGSVFHYWAERNNYPEISFWSWVIALCGVIFLAVVLFLLMRQNRELKEGKFAIVREAQLTKVYCDPGEDVVQRVKEGKLPSLSKSRILLIVTHGESYRFSGDRLLAYKLFQSYGGTLEGDGESWFRRIDQENEPQETDLTWFIIDNCFR